MSSNVMVEDQHAIHIIRPTYDQQTFDKLYDVEPPADDVFKGGAFTEMQKRFANCSPRLTARYLQNYIPVIKHWKEYQFKEWLLSDILSGISGGVVHVPQAMGYALLAGLPPVYGLYTSIFPGWLYYVFGTSRHLSVGTMALTSLMVGGVVNKEYMSKVMGSVTARLDNMSDIHDVTTSQTAYQSEITMTSQLYMVNDTLITANQQTDVAIKVGAAVSVTLIAGLFQLVMRLCRLGVIATYMSSSFISGFMTASAIQIMVSQLGLMIRRPYGTFEMPLTIYEVLRNISQTNFSALIASVSSIIFLVAIKEGVNERFKERLKVPIPAELILVVVGTLLAHFTQLNARYGLGVIGPIPTGFPSPRPPSLTSATSYIIDGILLGLVGFAIAISMAKLMAERHRYEINVDQELLASSIHNIISSFFSCFVSTQAPPRTMVHETTGCKTQLTGFISTFLPLLVILCIGPLFESLPVSVLGCIISCALIPLMKQFQQLRSLWNVSRYDFSVWIVTFISTVIISVTAGLIIGIGFSILIALIQIQRTDGYNLKQAGSTEIYLHSGKGSLVDKRTVIFRFDGSILFVNADKFIEELYKQTVHPLRLQTQTKTGVVRKESSNVSSFGRHKTNICGKEIDIGTFTMKDINSTSRDPTGMEHYVLENQTSNEEKIANVDTEIKIMKEKQVRTIVLDLTKASIIDAMGVNSLKKIWTAYRSVGIELVAAGCSKDVIKKLVAAGLVEKFHRQDECNSELATMKLYPSVHDAVVASR